MTSTGRKIVNLKYLEKLSNKKKKISLEDRSITSNGQVLFKARFHQENYIASGEGSRKRNAGSQ